MKINSAEQAALLQAELFCAGAVSSLQDATRRKVEKICFCYSAVLDASADRKKIDRTYSSSGTQLLSVAMARREDIVEHKLPAEVQ